MNNKHFDIDYLRKYVHGELTASEMHQIEIAAQRDEMLMDIIEGIEYELAHNLSNPQTELNKLIKKRSTQIESRPKMNFSFKTLGIAASLLLTLGIAIMYYYSANQPKTIEEFATIITSEEVDSSTDFTETDSIHLDHLIAENSAKKQSELDNISKNNNKTIANSMQKQDESPQFNRISGAKNIDLKQTIASNKPVLQEEVLIEQQSNKEKSSQVYNKQQIILAEVNVSAPTVSYTQNVKSNNMDFAPQSQMRLNNVRQRQAQEETANQQLLSNTKYINQKIDSSNSDTFVFRKENVNLLKAQKNNSNNELTEIIILDKEHKKKKNSEPINGIEEYTKALLKEINTSMTESYYIKIQFQIDDKGFPHKIQFLQSTHTELNTLIQDFLLKNNKWEIGEDREKVVLEIKK